MSRAFEGFEEFVAARWPDLEGVAFVVMLDAAAARQVTTAALATLHQHWREAQDEGRPGAAARRAVLSGSIAAAPSVSRNASPATDHPATVLADPGRLTDPGDVPDDDVVLTALETVLRGATPVERALVGAASLWGVGPDEVADLLGMPVGDVRDLDVALRARLVAARDEVGATHRVDPAGWTLDVDVDLDAVVESLLAAQGDPPGPVALVEERGRSVRRRALVAGGAVAAAAGVAAWWLLPRGPTASAGSAAASARPMALPSPDDPSWGSVTRWAPRGRLAADPGVRGLVLSRARGAGGRVLWADDVAGQRLVVSASLNAGSGDLVLQAWQGAAGLDPASMQEIHFTTGLGYDVGSGVLAFALPASPGALLVVLARPTVATAWYSATVIPTSAGVIERAWATVTLRGGIGSATWAQEPGPALRVRCAHLDGPAASTAPIWADQAHTGGLAGYAEETRRFVAAATGLPLQQLRTEVATDAILPASVIDPAARSPQDGDGRVRVLRTTTSGGALVRCARVVAGPMRIVEGRSILNSLEIEAPAVLPAGTPPEEPIVSPLGDLRPGVSRFLVIAPGAARVQLVPTYPHADPASKVTATRHGAAIVSITFAGEPADYRLVRHDAHGHRMSTLMPRGGRDLLDL